MMNPKDKIVFPLDVDRMDEALRWVDRLKDLVGVFKVGFELYTSCGPKVIEEIKKRSDNKIFLDLKLNDIPNTVLRTVRVASNLGVNWITVHALSGLESLRSAVSVAYNDLRIVAVTVLTSLERADLMELGFNAELVREVKDLVLRLARLAYQAGCDGIVCSAKEVSKVKELYPEFFTVVPGIRLEGAKKDDQVRVVTPYEAVLAGADYLVIGRPIRESFSPEKTCREIAEEIEKALLHKETPKEPV
ncbi:orotidine-5'-phosphate decarboxylase [Thermodesulfobacterium sp. TA1]|uniref:orotidine-5'-phosphate decarboxylase n=1 Tax=Thermodesulfobacterium sp. TA1 TaxID=2234087 RepID=UPI001231AB63|nr:orotidine-5'-phosphate decarboxylase [Thermodesulfobacterium sp. TA1]QER41740.1 orotidine-5'-phosphate decarboxylase [Thermodesulfobacterium sp. TA1]